VLLATDRPAALAAKSATATVPLIFSSGDDPVGVGLVPSLSTPGGNATGVSVFTNQLGPKRLELLREILPRPGVIAFVVNPNNESTPLQVATMESAAKAMGQPIVVVRAGTEDEVEAAFAAMQQRQLAGIVYGATTFYQVITERLVALAARHRIPAAYEWGDAVAAGGLMSYATDRVEIGRQMGAYAAQILKGAKPVDLPVVQSSKFVFALNLKTAKALGLAIPPSLLARADEVIE
jgi:putative ABC transport system substrate-binding protein